MAEEQKTPARPPDEILRDIASEREGLQSAFDALSADVQQTADSAVERARGAGRKALIVLPAAAAIVGAVAGAAALVRRRSRGDG